MNLDRDIDHVAQELTAVDAAPQLRARVDARLGRQRMPWRALVPVAAAATLGIAAAVVAVRPMVNTELPAVQGITLTAGLEPAAANPIAAEPVRARTAVGTSTVAPGDAPFDGLARIERLEIADIQPTDIDRTLLTIDALHSEPLRIDALDVAAEVIAPLQRGI